MKNYSSINGSSGSAWLRRRKLAVTHIFAKRRIEDFEPLMLDALHNLLNSFARRGRDAVFDLRAELTLCAAEFTLRLALGEDARTVDVKDALRIRDHNGMLFNMPAAWDSVPWLGNTLLRKGRRHFADGFNEAAAIYRPIMAKRLLNFDPEVEAHDYLDVLLQYVKRGELNEDQVAAMLSSDFFAAGTETATAAMEWVIGHVFQAPSEKLERLQKELDELNASMTSLLTQDDLTPERVPYLYAVIKETFRCVKKCRRRMSAADSLSTIPMFAML